MTDQLDAFIASADRLPPHDREAEEAVIASMLVDPELAPKLAPILQPTDFFVTKHERIYAAALALQERGEPINQITVGHELARHDELEDVGGIAYLSKLTTELATSVGAEYYATMIRRDAVYREFIDRQRKTATAAFSANGALPALLEIAEADLKAIRVMAEPVLAVNRPTSMTLDELLASTHSEVDWLVEGIFPRKSRCMIGGPDESAKSFALTGLILSAATTGKDWLGYNIPGAPLRSLIVDEDNPIDVYGERLPGLIAGLGIDHELSNIRFLVDTGASLGTPEGMAIIRSEVERFEPDYNPRDARHVEGRLSREFG
jgi:DnaB-like helicase N terminal domain/AAA domain